MNLEKNNEKKQPSNKIIFNLTENIKKIGISEFSLHKRDFLITWSNGRNSCIDFNFKSSSLSQNIKLIRKTLKNDLKDMNIDDETFDNAINDIEDQIIKRRDEIYSLNPTKTSKNNSDNEYKSKFSEEVSNIRKQFEKSSNPYKEWQQEVKKKYDNLENITIKHYPEGWPLMKFNLSVKTTLNIEGNKLPFIGIVLYKPSSLKTTFIEFFRKYHRTFFSDTFTPNAIISHNSSLTEEQLQEIDMLPKMQNTLVLTPELSSLFTVDVDSLTRTLGIIVRLADGDGLESDSGAHGHRGYPPTKFAWLGAAVEISPKIWTLLSQLGFKIYFLRPNFKEKSTEDLTKIIEDPYNNSKNKEIETALLEYLKVFDAAPKTDFSYIDENSGIVKIKWNYKLIQDFKSKKEQRKILEYISNIAKLLSRLRGTVYVSSSKLRKNQKSSKETANNEEDQDISIQTEQLNFEVDTDTIEDPSRAAIQLLNLALANAISQGRNYLIKEDVKLVIDVALSTTRVHRHKILNLLLRYGGELLTSKIVNELKISEPTARKTMRELDALGIVKASTTDGYTNSELKINLSNEFNWFLSEEFQKLRDDKTTALITTIHNQSNTEYRRMYLPLITKTLSNSYYYTTLQQKACDNGPCDSIGCHTLKENLPPETEVKYDNQLLDNDDDINKPKNSKLLSIKSDNDINSTDKEITCNNISNKFIDSNSNNTENYKKYEDTTDNIKSNNNFKNTESEQISIKEHNITDSIIDLNLQKNSVSLGPKNFQHVTVSHENCHREKEEEHCANKKQIVPKNVIEDILKVIRDENGSISLGNALQLACQRSKVVKEYFKDEKLASRKSRKVQNLFVQINRHLNIKVIKRKPQLVVKWIEQEQEKVVINN